MLPRPYTPRPEAVGEEPRGQPGQRAEEDRHRHQQGGLARGEMEVGTEAGGEGADQSPGREAQAERQGAQEEGTGIHRTSPVATIVPSTPAKRTVRRTRSTRTHYTARAFDARKRPQSLRPAAWLPQFVRTHPRATGERPSVRPSPGGSQRAGGAGEIRHAPASTDPVGSLPRGRSAGFRGPQAAAGRVVG